MTTLTAATVAAMNAVLLPADSLAQGAAVRSAFAATLSANLHSFGRSLSGDLLRGIADLSHAAASDLARDLTGAVRGQVGADLSVAKPMYPNFPRQVMEASDAELYVNAVMHYLGDAVGVRVLPRYRLRRRDLLDEVVHTQQLQVATPQMVTGHLERLLRSAVAWAPAQRDFMSAVLAERPDLVVADELPTIPNRENAALFAVLRGPELVLDNLVSVTDVLRVAVVLSGGEPSLADPPRFGRFSRPARRTLLAAIDRAPGDLTEDMSRHPELWKRLGERLHPGEHAVRFPRALAAFTAVRSKQARSIASQVETTLPDTVAVAHLLRTRPGELVRRLDHLLRVDPATSEQVLDVVRAMKAPSLQVVVQALAALSTANGRPALRIFVPKGAVGSAHIVRDTRPPLPAETVVSVRTALQDKALEILRTATPLGRTFVDPELKAYTVPFGVRSASRSLRTVGRGTRVPLPEKDTLRLFVHWRDVDAATRTDLDLSALMLDENFEQAGQVAYYSMRNRYAWHSGDITSAPQGASEFLDVHLPGALDAGVRYVAMTVHCYTRQAFQEVPDCFAGFMSRAAPQSGEIYEPTTVENRFDLAADSRSATPMVFDLVQRTAIWLDLNVDVERKLQRNLADSAADVSKLLRAVLQRPAPTLFDLLLLHARARGEVVTTRSDADTIFSTMPDSRLDVLDVAAINGDYLMVTDES